MQISSLIKATQFNNTCPTIEVLLQTEFRKELRIAFLENQVMHKHCSPFPIVIEIVEGTIELQLDESRYLAKKGDLISLEPQVPHALKAMEMSLVRLSLAKTMENQS